MAEVKEMRFTQQFCDRSPDGKVALPREIMAFLKIKPGDKITKLILAATIEARSFFLDVFENLGPDERWELRRRQHAIDYRRRKAGSFMAGPTYGPSSASGDSQRPGLLVECKEPCGFDRLGEFPNFGRLARLHCYTDRGGALALFPHVDGSEVAKTAR